jgi:hypothetical protein
MLRRNHCCCWSGHNQTAVPCAPAAAAAAAAAAGLPCSPHVTIDIETSTPLLEVKRQLQLATGIPVEHQKVSPKLRSNFQGRCLSQGSDVCGGGGGENGRGTGVGGGGGWGGMSAAARDGHPR